MKIKSISSRQILDSRGNPTVEVDLVLDNGQIGRASVPSGASTGAREAVELRDGGNDYGGQGVTKALHNIQNLIAPAVIDKDFQSQLALDDALCQLDGTHNKARLGANAILGVSLAYVKACAGSQSLYLSIAGTAKPKLPIPMFNVINGGKHARNSSDIQEYMIVPVGITGYAKQLQAGTEVFHALGSILSAQNQATTVGDEGGYALPAGSRNSDGLALLEKAITKAGYVPGKDISIALDVAASELFANGRYNLKSEQRSFTSLELIDFYTKLCQAYPIISIEDGLDQEDWQNWPLLNQKLGDKIMLVGDDLLVTNTKYIQQAIDKKACNAVLIKPNQIGTLSETVAAIELAHANGLKTVMSHRSGETEDTTIAHIAVGLGTKYMKSGSLSRSERLAKYNELLRIGEQL